jgi:hypothetical protein
MALGKIYPRPVPSSVSCEAGPLGSLARACPLGLAEPRGFPTGTAASRAGPREGLPLTRAPQRELRGGDPTWVPGPCLSVGTS